jgi:ferredoxin-NADP reductase/CRP-like cAMP-binding protein
LSRSEIDHLAHRALLGQVSVEAASGLFNQSKVIYLETGENLFKEGDIGDGVYLITKGELRVQVAKPDDSKIVMALIESGQLIGEHYLLEQSGGGKRGSDAQAANPCELLFVEGSTFLEFLKVHPSLAHLLHSRAAEREELNLQQRSQMFNLLNELDVVDLSQRLRFDSGEIIFKEGQEGDAAYTVVSGTVTIFHEATPDQPLIKVGVGQTFGERALITMDVRAASARAESAVTLLKLSAPQFQDLYRDSPAFHEMIQGIDFSYRLPQAVGQSSTYIGEIDGQPSINRLYELVDGRRIVSSWIPALKAFKIAPLQVLDTTSATTHHHTTWFEPILNDRPSRSQRSIQYDKHGHIKGLTCTGDWSDLPWLIDQVLSGAILPIALLTDFEATGRIRLPHPEPQKSSRESIVCNCLGLTQGAMMDKVASGLNTVELLRLNTGCGTICGGCIPTIEGLLGQAEWIPITASSTIETADVRSFVLKPDLDIPVVWHTGQYITISGRIDGLWISRNYTLISPPESNHPMIAVKREPLGMFSRWFFDGDPLLKQMRIAQPRGNETWSPEGPPTVCFVAGIGVTPAIAIVRAAISEGQAGRPAPAVNVHYSGRSEAELPFLTELRQAVAIEPSIQLTVRLTAESGRLQADDIAIISDQYQDARYFVCGPPAYINTVVGGLQTLGLPQDSIHVERFTHAGGPPVLSKNEDTNSSIRAPFIRRAYGAGLLIVAVLLLILASPELMSSKPTGYPNTGHSDLACNACHVEAPGTARQQLQAKVQFLLGQRESDSPWQHQPVSNKNCMDCHDRPKDMHAPHLFLESKYALIREELGPDQCVSCHREHRDVRVTNTEIEFCSACHQEMNLKNDPLIPPASPSHAELVNSGQWSSCLGCHDYHGNHLAPTPTDLGKVISIPDLQKYFRGGDTPYGPVRLKAVTPSADATNLRNKVNP